MTAPERKKLRVLALVHPDLIPPEDAKRDDASPWKMEYDVVHALTERASERGMRVLIYSARTADEEIERLGDLVR